MAFEFFFGLFGLISSNSKSHHKSRIDGDWRLFTPLGANLFKDATGQKSSTLLSTNLPPAAPLKTSDKNFTTSGVFSSGSSASSISSSSTSISTISSTVTLVKSNEEKKYDFVNTKPGRNDDVWPSPLGNLTSDQDNTTTTKPDEQEAQAQETDRGPSNRARSVYCAVVCLCLWIQVVRFSIGLAVERTIVTLDLFYLATNRIHFLIPSLCLAIQAAAVSLIFIRNNNETNWLVPFYSSMDYLIRSRSNFRPKMANYRRRINTSVGLALSLAALSSLSMAAYLVHCVSKSKAIELMIDTKANLSVPLEPGESSKMMLERVLLIVLLVYDILWAIYSTYICFLVSFYFNLICSIMKAQFHGISKIIEDLAESNTRKTTNQARKITILYLEHNEACELLDESNDFWQYLIFFTYFTYIPAYCYCLYNLFFVDFEPWPSFITWVINIHMGFIIVLISFSAAGVSTEAHAPYTSLHTLSLIQLPLDVEVNITTFLHRVRGLTIGYSCYDLFAITNASMSNTAAACASYFLIVADFSRSSVFNLTQINGSIAGVPGMSNASNVIVSTQAPTAIPT